VAAQNFRGFTVKQLAKASADSWDDPRTLAAILAEARRRPLDAPTDTLIRSNTRRLSALHYQPGDDEADSGERTAPRAKQQDATPRRRRRILFAAMLSGAAVGAAAVLLAPREKLPEADPRPVGVQVSGATARPTPSPPPRAPERAIASMAPAPPAQDRAPPPDGPRQRSPRVSLAAVEAEVVRIEQQRLLHERLRYLAEAGVRLGPQHFQCLVSDPDPRRCTPGTAHETEPVTAQPRARNPLEPQIIAVRSPVPAAGTERAPAARDRADGSFLGRATGMLTAAEPPRPPTPQQGAADSQGNPADSCTPSSGRLVFVMDGSLSMGLPIDLDPAIEDSLDEGISNKDDEARRQYRALLALPGPKRMSRAIDAFETAVKDLPDSVELGLIAFRECRDIRTYGVFDAPRRPAAIDAVRAIVPNGRTPLAESLRRASDLLDEGPSAIVLLTDGREFCSGDPCAAAAEIKARHKETSIHVIDIGGHGRTECVAQATGGRSYSPAMADDLGRTLRQALRSAVQCPVTAENSPQQRPAAGPPATTRR